MNRATKRLLAENNALEQGLNAENRALLTDLVVYLRAAPISEYQQELVRRDITHMMLDGERRGDAMQSVLGEDYCAFCDQVVAALPRRTARGRALEALGSVCFSLSLLGAIWLGFGLLENLLLKQGGLFLPFTAGDALGAAAILAAAHGIVFFICRFSLEKSERRTKILVFLTFLVCLVCLTVSFFLKAVLFEVHALAALAGLAALFGLHKALEAIAPA